MSDMIVGRVVFGPNEAPDLWVPTALTNLVMVRQEDLDALHARIASLETDRNVARREVEEADEAIAEGLNMIGVDASDWGDSDFEAAIKSVLQIASDEIATREDWGFPEPGTVADAMFNLKERYSELRTDAERDALRAALSAARAGLTAMERTIDDLYQHARWMYRRMSKTLEEENYARGIMETIEAIRDAINDAAAQGGTESVATDDQP